MPGDALSWVTHHFRSSRAALLPRSGTETWLSHYGTAPMPALV